MSVTDKINKRVKTDSESTQYKYGNNKKNKILNTLQKRLQRAGSINQWERIRQDKLRSLKKALFYSYQSAIVQKYDVKKDSLANNLISIITLLQDQQLLSDFQIKTLKSLEENKDYVFPTLQRYDQEYIKYLQDIVNSLTTQEPLFRCLINHDKLKVNYQDKIISIPFEEPPVGEKQSIETSFHNGTVFKWVHGNKEEWTPDTYWIVYMQYSQETAYFRAEIRKADQEIEIIVIDQQGNENTVSYRGWMTGPNETTALWNIKKGIVWNDLNYTKLLYITKDENTLAFFQRFDRIIINGKPWEVQAYNESYSVNKSDKTESGIIRVALKETYTNTKEFVQKELTEMKDRKKEKEQYDLIHTDPYIDGPDKVTPYEIVTFTAKNFDPIYNNKNKEVYRHWTLYGTELAKIKNTSIDRVTVTVEIVTPFSNKEGFYINYGDSPDTMKQVIVDSL